MDTEVVKLTLLLFESKVECFEFAIELGVVTTEALKLLSVEVLLALECLCDPRLLIQLILHIFKLAFSILQFLSRVIHKLLVAIDSLLVLDT